MKKREIQVGKTYESFLSGPRKTVTRTIVAEGLACQMRHPGRVCQGGRRCWIDDQDWIRYRDENGEERGCTRAAFARWADREVVNG